MATEAENIQTRLAQIAQELVDLGNAGPKPTYSENGRSVDWTGYKRALIEERKSLREDLIRLLGPFEVYS